MSKFGDDIAKEGSKDVVSVSGWESLKRKIYFDALLEKVWNTVILCENHRYFYTKGKTFWGTGLSGVWQMFAAKEKLSVLLIIVGEFH